MSQHFPQEKILTARDLEFYTQGIWDLWVMLTGESHCKYYDPMTINADEKIAHSYVLDLQDGGRHHPYQALDILQADILSEFAKKFRTLFADDEMDEKARE